MKQLKKTLLTLVALLAVTAGAWAEEKSETILTNTRQVEYTGEHFKITPNRQNDNLMVADLRYYDNGQDFFSVQTLDGQNISKLDLQIDDIYEASINNLSLSSGNKSYDSNTKVLTITNVNADHVQISLTEEDQFGIVTISSVTYYYEESGTTVPLTWDATAKTATLTNGMPAGNVTVSVDYFAQAEFAMSTDATPVALAPKASTSARANTDDPLVEGGTVAGIVDDEAVLEEGQGTLLYHFSAKQLDADALEALTAADWTDKVPTADGLAEGTVYVYYYIKGADDQPGITPGAKFTFSDSDIQELAVTLLPEPTYNVEFAEGTNPEAPAKPIWTATPNTGVKKGQTVTVTYTGDRKVIGVKAEKKATKLTITIPATANAAALTLDVTGCTTWEQILDQNITTLDYEGDGVYGQTSNCYILDGNNNRLNLNTPYDSTTNYHWGTQR